MKKRFLISLFLSAMALTTLHAADHYEGNFFVGAKGGCTLSRTQFSPAVSQGMLPGATAGVSVRYIEEEHFGLIAELNFTQRGWKESFGDDSSLSYSRTISYLQLPVLAHIYFGSPRAHFFVNAGPEVGVKLSESTSANFDITNLPADFPQPRQSYQLTAPVTQKIDFGISAGLGAEYFSSSRSSLLFEARLYYGLGNIFPSKRTDIFSASSGLSIALTLGYNFRVK